MVMLKKIRNRFGNSESEATIGVHNLDHALAAATDSSKAVVHAGDGGGTGILQ